jgi:murein DD-endopeptidase MepM/ murein hydrolase activator NlpD
MCTIWKPRIGLLIAILGSLAISLLAPALANAQDFETASPDTRPPVITQPQDLQVAAVDASGATVSYQLPDANDKVDGNVPVSCSPAPNSLFPLGQTLVECQAVDAAGNKASVSFAVTVTDQTPPVIAAHPDVVVDAVDSSGVPVSYAAPVATDNVDGSVGVVCDVESGATFPIGATVVNCNAKDGAGNSASPIAFQVIVNPLPTPTATEPPEATEEPTATAEPNDTESPTPAETPTSTDDRIATATPTATKPPSKETETPNASKTPSSSKKTNQTKTPATSTPTPKEKKKIPPALALPWPPPDSFVLVTDGGPIDGLSAIWRNQDFPITQEFGHTDFSVRHHRWYAYGASFGLDGYEHPGIDIGMPAGTWLYAPVDGVVKVAGGVQSYTYYGNGQPGVGELMIETDDGDEVILGHMGLIVVGEGQRVEVGQFVGLSGGDNGDHLHLETREKQWWGGYVIVDPRKSFLIESLQKEASKNDSKEPAADKPKDRKSK